MRVVCIDTGLPDPLPVGLLPALTLRKEYVVISILVKATVSADEHAGLLQVIDNSGEATWHPPGRFQTTSTRIPRNWVAAIDEKANIMFSPAAWLERGFWPRQVDQELGVVPEGDAMEIYRRELASILRSEEEEPEALEPHD